MLQSGLKLQWFSLGINYEKLSAKAMYSVLLAVILSLGSTNAILLIPVSKSRSKGRAIGPLCH